VFAAQTRNKEKPPLGGAPQEEAGFERLFSADALQKNSEIHKVFPNFFILPKRIISRSKLRSTLKRWIFSWDKAKSAGILAYVFRAFLTQYRGKRRFSGLLIPTAHRP